MTKLIIISNWTKKVKKKKKKGMMELALKSGSGRPVPSVHAYMRTSPIDTFAVKAAIQ